MVITHVMSAHGRFCVLAIVAVFDGVDMCVREQRAMRIV
jgi:hypothetical protein